MNTADQRWAAYYERLKDRPPRFTSVFAQRRFSQPGFAVDLGAGGGRDTIPLLVAGWRVLALDQEYTSIKAIRDSVPDELVSSLKLSLIHI